MMLASYKYTSPPSPHNIYCMGSGLSSDFAVRFRGAPLSRGVITRGNCVSRSPCRVSFATPEYQQFLIGFESYGSPVVGVWDRAGPTSGNGIIPITDRTFISSVLDRPGGAGCYRLSYGHKKSACVWFDWEAATQAETISTKKVVMSSKMSYGFPKPRQR